MLPSKNKALLSLLIFVGTVAGTTAMELAEEPVSDKLYTRLQITGQITGGGTGTIVKYNPTGKIKTPTGEPNPNYDGSKTLVGCLTAAHVETEDAEGNSVELRLLDGTLLKMNPDKANGGFSFRGFGSWRKNINNKDNPEGRLYWRIRGSDWRFIGLKTVDDGTPITKQNVADYVEGTPYQLEYKDAPEDIVVGSLLNNLYHKNIRKGRRRGDINVWYEEHVGEVTKVIREGMYRTDNKLGGGSSGSPIYSQDWKNIVGVNRGGGIFTGINTVLNGHNGKAGLRRQALSYFGL